MLDHLPRSFKPVRYDIRLEADPAKPSFRGLLRLEGEVVERTPTLTLHAKGLAFISARAAGLEWAWPATTALDEASETVELRFQNELPVGPLALEIEYTGTISAGMEGLYLARDGPDQMLATQCEATDARRFLPCLDEPDRKAAFAWTVTSPKGNVVLANGREVERSDNPDGTTTWRFQATPPMASYLVATVVGALGGGATTNVGSVPIRSWALGGREELGDHGRDVAAKLLPWYETYFGQPYAFGKYDQVAVPSFAFGAMENAGLVTFRPTLLLMDPKTAGWEDRRQLSLVVAHEFAHMWFGNLVTMAWWDDLWLNEAFAEWIAHGATHAMDPSLDVWSSFQGRASGALDTDTLRTTHAIYHPVKTAREAAEMFDAITYGKGSAVLRMLEAYLGPEPFRAGLRSYMAQFRFANARGEDLWSHLGKASKQDVGTLMGIWVTQPGHPVLTVALEGSNQLRLRQRRARFSPVSPASDGLWRLPIVIRYQDGEVVQEHKHLMTAQEETITIPAKGEIRWLWPNADGVGFWQVQLEGDLLGRTVRSATALHAAERVALARDLWLAVRANDIEPGTFLKAFEGLLDGEAPYDVVQGQVGLLRRLERYLEAGRPAALAAFRAWVAARLSPSLRKMADAKPGEDPRTGMRRAALLRAVGGIARDPEGIGMARRLAAEERKEPGSVPADLADAAVAIEAITGDKDTLDTFLATYRNRREARGKPQEVERYLNALASFRVEAQVKQVLAVLDEPGMPTHAVAGILRNLLAEPHGQMAAWAWFTPKLEALKPRLGEAWLGHLVEATGEMPPAQAAAVKAFWDANLAGSAKQAYGRAVERLDARGEMVGRITPALEAWALGLSSH